MPKKKIHIHRLIINTIKILVLLCEFLLSTYQRSFYKDYSVDVEGVNAEITRPARKLYVGNLPTDLGLTEKMLVQFFTACLKGLGFMTDIPIMSAWINGDQTFAVRFQINS